MKEKNKREERIFGDYPTALAKLREELDGRSFDPDVNYIVLTPDRYTQSVERALFTGGGALDCEVLTISRLAMRISPVTTLSREGGVMLIASAIADVKDELEYFKRAACFSGFAREAYATLLQIGASDVLPSAAAACATDRISACKLRDLARIKARYDILKKDNADGVDRLLTLIDELPKSELIRRSHIYLIGYSLGDIDTTKLNRRVFDRLAACALSLTEYKVVPPARRLDAVEVFAAPDRISQYKQIACKIREFTDIQKGAYGDVSVVCPEPRALIRILKEYGISAYADESTPLFDCPSLAAIYYIYKLKTGGDGATLVSLCKNPFSGVAEDDALILGQYLVTRGMGFGALDRDYTNAPSGVRNAIARARALTDAFAGRFSDAVDRVIDFGEFERIGEELELGNDIVTPVLELSELLRSFGSGDFERDADSFFSAARALEVKSVPTGRDRVTVTLPQTLRLTRCRFLIVADFNEGVLPVASADNGLLADNEIGALEKAGSVIEPKVSLKNKRERIELQAVVLNAEKVYFTYSESGRGKPSSFIGMLADKIDKRTYSDERTMLERDGVTATTKNGNIFYSPTDGADHKTLLFHACTEGAAREIAARKESKLFLSVAAAAGESGMRAAGFKSYIDGKKRDVLSVSELTDYFTCPYKRFLRYSIGLKERKTGELGAPDFGIIVHEFMELFVKDGSYDCSRDKAAFLLKKALKKKNIDIEDEYVMANLIDDAVDFAEINTDILRSGEYSPVATETNFNVDIGEGGNKAGFYGVIDRVDECGDHIRIIDYKTGKKSFCVEKCLNGTDMQLPLYAAAVERNGANDATFGKKITGLFYVTLAQKYDDGAKPASGKMIMDGDIVLEYDKDIFSGEPSGDGYIGSRLFSVRVKESSDGPKIHGGSGSILTEENFRALIDRCVRNARVAYGEIEGGYIDRAPIDGGCDRCPFGGICGNSVTVRGEGDSDDE